MYNLRPLTAADIDAAAMFTARIFAPDNVEVAWAQLRMAYHGCPFMPIDLCFALEEDGHVVAQWQLLDYTLRIGRARVRAAGCFGLASAADARGQHLMHTAALLGRTIPVARGFDVLLGFAKNSRAFLQMEGTVPFGAEYRWSLPLDDAMTSSETPHFCAVDTADADADTIEAITRWHNQAHTGVCNIVRTPEMWPWMLRKPPELFIGTHGYLGVRVNGDALEIREAAGETPAFYARALAFAMGLAQARGLSGLSGHLPVDHPLVQHSYPFGAQVQTDYTRKSGSFAGLMQPQWFMEKLAVELEHRWARSFPEHRLLLHVTTFEGESFDFTHVYNHDAQRVAELHLDVPPGSLFQLCIGYASPRAVLTHAQARAKAWMGAGDIPLDPALDTLFPKATPFIVHGDRY